MKEWISIAIYFLCNLNNFIWTNMQILYLQTILVISSMFPLPAFSGNNTLLSDHGPIFQISLCYLFFSARNSVVA